MSFGEHMYTFLLDMYLGVELLGHKDGICSASVDTVKQCFPSSCRICTFLGLLMQIAIHKGFLPLHFPSSIQGTLWNPSQQSVLYIFKKPLPLQEAKK